MKKANSENLTVSAIAKEIDRDEKEDLASVGVLVGEEQRSGTFILRDSRPICARSQYEGLELLPIAEALTKYDWLRERYAWKAVPADLDDVTARCAALAEPQGYFIHVSKGAKVSFPCQAGLWMSQGNVSQLIHNIVILEEGAELVLFTGCLTGIDVTGGLHLAISEHYVGPNAKLTNTMVHSWGAEVEVYPRSGTIVEAGGQFVSNYVSLRPAKRMETNPQTWLNGRDASARYATIVLGSSGSTIETGGKVHLNAEGTRAEVIHRAICTGGRIYQKGLLIGNARCRAHVDCSGMVLDSEHRGFIQAVPGLRAVHPDAQMSHEASIGKIAPEQVEYLQSRGLDEGEAISMIIRGFLAADIKGLGPELDARIAELAELASQGGG